MILNILFIVVINKMLFWFREKLLNFLLKDITKNQYSNKIKFLIYLYKYVYRALDISMGCFIKHGFSYMKYEHSLKDILIGNNLNVSIFINKNIVIIMLIFLSILKLTKIFLLFIVLILLFCILKSIKYIYIYLCNYKYMKYLQKIYDDKCKEILKWYIEYKDTVHLLIYISIELIEKEMQDFKYSKLKTYECDKIHYIKEMENCLNLLNESDYKKFDSYDYLVSLQMLGKTTSICIQYYIKILISFCKKIEDVNNKVITNSNVEFRELISLIESIIIIEKYHKRICCKNIVCDDIPKLISPILKVFKHKK